MLGLTVYPLDASWPIYDLSAPEKVFKDYLEGLVHHLFWELFLYLRDLHGDIPMPFQEILHHKHSIEVRIPGSLVVLFLNHLSLVELEFLHVLPR